MRTGAHLDVPCWTALLHAAAGDSRAPSRRRGRGDAGQKPAQERECGPSQGGEVKPELEQPLSAPAQNPKPNRERLPIGGGRNSSPDRLSVLRIATHWRLARRDAG